MADSTQQDSVLCNQFQWSCRQTYAPGEQEFIPLPCFCPHFQCYTHAWHKPLEIIAVNNIMNRWGLGLLAATASLGLFVATANAQLAPAPKPPAVPAAPAVPKAPAAAPAVPGAATAAKPAAAKTEKKAPSACAKLDKATCEANAECTFVEPKTANKTTGKVQAAHCKKKPTAPVAKKAAAAAPAAGAAPAAPKVPTAAVPKAPAAAGTAPKPQ